MKDKIALIDDDSGLMAISEDNLMAVIDGLNDVGDLLEANKGLRALEQAAAIQGLDDAANKLRRVRIAVVCRIAEVAPNPGLGRPEKNVRPVEHLEDDPGIPRSTLAGYRAAAAGVEKMGGMDAIKELDEPPTMKQLAEMGKNKRARSGKGINSDDEWYTPPALIEASRLALGAIDLDPASCEVAQEVVKADRYFTIEDDGLARKWAGRVFMNPPYSRKSGKHEFIKRAAEYYKSGEVKAAIIVLSYDFSASWFDPLQDIWSSLCLMKGRVQFYKETPGR